MLLETINRLFKIVYQTPDVKTAVQCHQSLYAASLLATSADLLRLRSIDPLNILPTTSRYVSAEILANPIEWSSIQILLTPDGEQHFGQILKTYDLRQMDVSDRRQILQRLMAALGKRELLNDIGLQNVELRRRAEALRVLETIRQEKEDQQLQMIDNLVWFRDKNLSMGHLMEMLLIPPDDLKHYSISCLVFGAFVQAMKIMEYRTVFWKRITYFVDNNGERAEIIFHQCCKLISFYESILDHIKEYLGSVRQIELGNGEVEWIGDHLEFYQVRSIVCLMLCNSSFVRQRFADHLHGLELSVELRCDLYQVLLYE